MDRQARLKLKQSILAVEMESSSEMVTNNKGFIGFPDLPTKMTLFTRTIGDFTY